jgi:hypothetical protein
VSKLLSRREIQKHFATLAVILMGCGAGALANVESQAGGELLYEEPKELNGSILSFGPSPKLLFRFERKAERSGSTLHVRRDYISAEGQLAARETVVYEGNDLRSYDFNEMQSGIHGTVSISPDPKHPAQSLLRFEYRERRGERESKKEATETLGPNTLTGDMVAPFLTSRWKALMAGEKVKCRYIVLARAETVGFTFTRQSESTWHQKPVFVIKMEATSPILSVLVDPLYFYMEKAEPHRILQYTGRTTPHIKVDGKWKDLDAVTVFDWKQ